MNSCQIKKGIFVLKECGEFAGVTCGECQKYVCAKHAKQDGAKLVCYECFAVTHQNEILGNRNINSTSSATESMLWYFATRHNFHASSSYHPFNDNDYHHFNSPRHRSVMDDNTSGSLIES